MSYKIHQSVKWCKNHEKRKTDLFSRKPLPSSPSFASFLLPVFVLENRTILFETCTFVNIL
jgi:hypothetical protein